MTDKVRSWRMEMLQDWLGLTRWWEEEGVF